MEKGRKWKFLIMKVPSKNLRLSADESHLYAFFLYSLSDAAVSGFVCTEEHSAVTRIEKVLLLKKETLST